MIINIVKEVPKSKEQKPLCFDDILSFESMDDSSKVKSVFKSDLILISKFVNGDRKDNTDWDLLFKSEDELTRLEKYKRLSRF